MPDESVRGVDAPAPQASSLTPPPPIAHASVGGASRGGGIPDDTFRSRALWALAHEIETLPTTHAALARLLGGAVELLDAGGAWIGLTMEDTDSLAVIAAHGDVAVNEGTRVPRDRAFAARALSSHAAVFADPSTGVRWSDTVVADAPVRAVAAPVLVDGVHAVGVIAIVGGPGRLFTASDGAFAHELGALAAGVLRRRESRVQPVETPSPPRGELGIVVPLLLDAAAALTVDDFATTVLPRLDHEAFLGVSVAVIDQQHSTMRFVAAHGALAALRGVRVPLAVGPARSRRATQLADARHIVPDGWRSLVPALPGASVLLLDHDLVVGRIDVVFDPDRGSPDDATRRLEQQAGTVARAIAALESRAARAPTDTGAETLNALRTELAARVQELTSPIAGISALAELLSDEPMAPELLELVELIQRSAKRASSTAQSMRLLAEGGDATLEPVEIETLVRELLSERAEAQRALAITVTVSVDPQLPPVTWPRDSLREWLSAAIVASETALLGAARRRIEVRAGLDGGNAVVTIADDGAPVGVLPSEVEAFGATMSVVRTDDGRTIRRLTIPLRIGTPPLPS